MKVPFLATLTQAQLDDWVSEARMRVQAGQLPDYIPQLAAARRDWFAMQIQAGPGQVFVVGDPTLSFPLMSVIKPFILLYLLERLGTETVFSHVGMDPSEQPFNALTQLQADGGFPRNPMLNSGAIALAALLPGENAASCCRHFSQWLNQQANCHLTLDAAMLSSVQSLPNQRNRAIASALAESGHLATPAAPALATYEHVCCLAGTVADLAGLGMLLTASKAADVKPQHCQTVKAVMGTCGLYELSGRFAVEAGLPTKSGVSGAVLSAIPGQGAIACYSPPLDAAGNSVVGLFLIKRLSQSLNLSIFR